MTVKMTQRDKKLLSFLAVFIVVVFFIVYAILPLLDESSSLNGQMEMAQKQKIEMDGKLALKDQYTVKMENYQEEWSKIKEQLLPCMQSNEIDALMTQMIQTCDLTAVNENITFVDTKVLNTYSLAAPYVEAADPDADLIKKLDVPETPVTCYEAAEVTVTVEGEKQSIQNLIDLIAQKRPAILLKQISYESVQDDQMKTQIELLI